MGQAIVISCKNGKVFAACQKEHISQQWKDEELYYQNQGCIVSEVDEVKFGQKHECEHCDSLEHNFDYDKYD